MINNAVLQEAIVTRLQTESSGYTILTNTDEIRAMYWAGRDFVYPCIRVGKFVQVPGERNLRCTTQNITFDVAAYTKDTSPKNCDTIIYEVTDTLHDKSFTLNAVKFSAIRVTLRSPIYFNGQIWISRANISAQVQAE